MDTNPAAEKVLDEASPATPTPGNNSGTGKHASLPPGARGWCWGALLLGGVWAIRHRVWIGLFAFVPVLGWPVAILLGYKGRKLAWQATHWPDVATFNETQALWTISGIAFHAALLLLISLLFG